jgi:O-antigen/teichoic acid export membrane protein/thymidylate kinase
MTARRAAPVRDARAERPGDVLPTISALCDALEAEGVRYCHWKSNEAIDRSASGENDLDLLVSEADADRFSALLRRLGFRTTEQPGWKHLPGTYHAYGLDAATGRFVHIHAHERLVVGDDMTKNVHLPIEEPYLTSATRGPVFRVPAPEYELTVFAIRMVLKHCTWDGILSLQGSLSASERRELTDLRARADRAEVDRILVQHLPSVAPDLWDRCLRSIERPTSFGFRVATAWRLQHALAGSSRRQPVLDTWLRIWRRGRTVIRRKVLRRGPVRSTMASGGAVIAIVGGDGAGKSTVVDGLARWLQGEHIAVETVHLGKPGWSPLSAFVKTLMRLAAASKRSSTSSAKALRASLDSGGGRLTTRDRARLVWEVLTARDRYRTYRRARRLAARGAIVLCDRFPLAEITQMDGAVTARISDPARYGGWARRMASLERRYYDRIGDPDVLIVLRVHPDVAVERRRGLEPETSVRPRSEEIWALDWSGTDAVVVDAGAPIERVLSEVKGAMWSRLGPSPSSGAGGRVNGAEVRRRGLAVRAFSRLASDGSLTKKASLNAAASVSEQASRFLAGLIVFPILVSRLGRAGFGTWQFLRRLIGYTNPASGRPGEALKWTIAHEQHSTDVDFKRRAVGNAVAVWLLFLPLMLAIGGALAWFSPNLLQRDLEPGSFATVRLAAAILVVDAILFSLLYLPQAVLQGENLGYKRLGLSIVLVFVSKSLLVVAVLIGTGIPGLAVAAAIATVLWGLTYVWIVRSRVPWFGIARPSFSEVRSFIRLSGWFLVWNLVMTIMLGSDVVVLGVVQGTSSVAVYVLAKFLPQAIILAVATGIVAIMPGLGGLIGAGDLSRAARVRRETLSLIWLVTVAAGTTVLLWEASFLRLWSDEASYPGPGAMLMIMLMVLQFSLIRTDANIIDLTLNLRRKVLLGAVAAALSVGLAWFFLGPMELGIAGLALGFILGRTIQSVSYPLMIGRVLGVEPWQQFRGLVRPAIATAVLFGVATVAGAELRVGSWPSLIAAAATSGLVMTGLTFLGGLSADGRRLVWHRVRRVVRLT